MCCYLITKKNKVGQFQRNKKKQIFQDTRKLGNNSNVVNVGPQQSMSLITFPLLNSHPISIYSLLNT